MSAKYKLPHIIKVDVQTTKSRQNLINDHQFSEAFTMAVGTAAWAKLEFRLSANYLI